MNDTITLKKKFHKSNLSSVKQNPTLKTMLSK